MRRQAAGLRIVEIAAYGGSKPGLARGPAATGRRLTAAPGRTSPTCAWRSSPPCRCTPSRRSAPRCATSCSSTTRRALRRGAETSAMRFGHGSRRWAASQPHRGPRAATAARNATRRAPVRPVKPPIHDRCPSSASPVAQGAHEAERQRDRAIADAQRAGALAEAATRAAAGDAERAQAADTRAESRQAARRRDRAARPRRTRSPVRAASPRCARTSSSAWRRSATAPR